MRIDYQIPIIGSIEELFSRFFLEVTNDAKDIISGIVINEELYSLLNLVQKTNLQQLLTKLGIQCFSFLRINQSIKKNLLVK